MERKELIAEELEQIAGGAGGSLSDWRIGQKVRRILANDSFVFGEVTGYTSDRNGMCCCTVKITRRAYRVGATTMYATTA